MISSITVHIPLQPKDVASLPTTTFLVARTTPAQGIVLIIPVWESRVFWTILDSCLFPTVDRSFLRRRRIIRALLSIYGPFMRKANEVDDDFDDMLARPQGTVPIQSRQCTVRLVMEPAIQQQQQQQEMRRNTLPTDIPNITIWIVPPVLNRLETSFMGRLIQWEHKLIRALSLSGYFATLGGGFFLCHHFQTAVQLAREQQRMALLLNDYGMYYRCAINMAYNLVYVARFRLAQKLIDIVQREVRMLQRLDPALIEMCQSAALFGRRMKEAYRSHYSNLFVPGRTGARGSQIHKRKSKTVDDLARIRVFKDQSMKNDLTIPFGNHPLIEVYTSYM